MATPFRVLYVGDGSDEMRMVAEDLEREAECFEVVTETSASGAISRLDEGIDCVVGARRTADVEGLSFLDAVRERSDLPFILATDRGSEELASEAISRGATDYVRWDGEGYADLAERIQEAVSRHRARLGAEHARRRFQTIIERSTDAISVLDAEGRIQYASPSLARLLGECPEELQGEQGLGYVHPDDRERVKQAFAEALDTPDRAVEVEYRVPNADDGISWVESRFRNLLSDPDVEGVVEYTRDVTERREYGARIRALHEVASDLESLDTEEAVCRRTVEAAEEVLEFDLCVISIEEDGYLPAKAISEELPPGGTTTMSIEEGITGLTYRTGESYLIDDAEDHEEANPQGPYRSAVSVPIGEVGVFQAISEKPAAFDSDDVELAELLASHAAESIARIRSEAKLREERDRYETIVETAPDGVFVLDGEGAVEEVNETGAAMLGYDPGELLGRTPADLIEDGVIEPGLEESYNGAIREILSSSFARERAKIEGEVSPIDGERRTVEIHISPLPMDEGFRGTVGVVRDVTDRTRRERELEQYETIVETVPDGVFVLDAEGNVVTGNTTSIEMLGYDPGELLDQSFERLVEDGIYDEDIVDTYIEEIRAMLSSETDRETARFEQTVTVDGEERVFETHLALRPFEEEFRGTIGVLRDITRRIEYERELERQNERLEEFTSVVSHDLRNPLNVARGWLDIARESPDEETFDRIERALDRMHELIEDLLALARQGEAVTETEPVELGEFAERCWTTVETAGADLRVEGDLRFSADSSRLRQLVENLFRNSIKHGGEYATVRVGALDSGFFIEDDGPGIPEDERERVFEVGHSTADDGVGLGLTIVHRIAEAHGWEVRVTEGRDGGARFEVTGVETLPRDAVDSEDRNAVER